MGFLLLVVFPLVIEVTLQFHHIPWDQPRPPTMDEDYIRCTTKMIEEIRGSTTANLRFYTGGESANEVSLITQSLFDMDRPISFVISKPYELDRRRIVHEKVCIAVVNTMALLRTVLSMLYRDIHHQKCVICVTFQSNNAFQHLSRITEDIWSTGVPRNVVFVVANFDDEVIRIIGVPAYSQGRCLDAKIMEVGQYRDGKFLEHSTGLYPRLNDLGGCELSVMVQPPMLPYVERMENSPGGVVGDFMEMMATSMNFTTTYVWSVTHEDMLNHLYSRDLNLLFDMIPRAAPPATDYRFSLGIVGVTFIVPARSKQQMWHMLFAPFDRWIWLAILIILSLLVLLSSISGRSDVGKVLLQTFGTLLGVGVGEIMTQGWIRVFLWCWLLPAYVLIQSYLAYLAKEFTVPTLIPEIQSLAELANSKLDVMCTAGTQQGICKLREESFQKLCLKCRLVSDVEFWSDFYPNLMSTSNINDSSGIANLEFLEAHPAFLNVYAIEDIVTQVNQLAEVRPGSAWIFEMEKIWERICASGLVHYWRHRYIDRKRRRAASNSIGLFRPEFAWCSFYVLTVGWLMSLACFVAELILYRLYSIMQCKEDFDHKVSV